MKTKILFIALTIIISIGNLFSQNKNKSPEVKSENLTKEMVALYSLTTEQKAKVQPINLKYFKDDLDIRIKDKKRPKFVAARQKELRNKYDESILAILDKNQQVKYQQEAIKRNNKIEVQKQQKAKKK